MSENKAVHHNRSIYGDPAGNFLEDHAQEMRELRGTGTGHQLTVL